MATQRIREPTGPQPFVKILFGLFITIFPVSSASLAQTSYFEPTRLMTQVEQPPPQLALEPRSPQLTSPMQSFQEIIDDGAKLRQVLRQMRDGLREDLPLGELIGEIRAGGGQNRDNVSRGLTGLGGIFGHALLQAAEAKATGGVYNVPFKIIISSRGHIDGYFFDHQNNGGYLNVTTEITVGFPGGTVDIYRYRYEVKIGKNVFQVLGKDLTDPSNVFPGSDIRVDAMTASPFNYKLWAKGPEIKVVRLWVDHDQDGIFEPNERITSANHGDWRDNYRHILRPDPDACIDMMFMLYPPETLPPGAAPPYYCLGRCANPPLINTR